MLPPSASFTTEESNEYTNLFADIEAYVAETTVKFINGTEDIDANWDKFQSTLENMNYQRCVELKQASVDRYYGKVWKLGDKDWSAFPAFNLKIPEYSVLFGGGVFLWQKFAFGY